MIPKAFAFTVALECKKNMHWVDCHDLFMHPKGFTLSSSTTTTRSHIARFNFHSEAADHFFFFFWHIQIDFLETLYSKLDSSHIRWWFWNAIPIRFLQMHLGPDVLAADLRFQSVFLFIFLFTWTVPPRRCQIQSDGSATEQPLSSNMEDNTENSRQWTDTEIHFLLSLCGEASKCFHVGKAASPA